MSDVPQPDLAGNTGIGNFRLVSQAVTTGLTLKRFAPCPALRQYVQCYWLARGRVGGEPAGVELLHPDGAAGLLFNFGGALERDGERMRGNCWVEGPKRHTARLAVGETLDLLGVHFRPGMAYPFVGEALSALVGGELTPGDALRRLELEALHEQLHETPDFPARIALLEGYLLERLRRHEAPAVPALVASLDWLQRRHGQGSIAELVEELPFGQRRLERLFQHHVGLSPKRYARLLRVAYSRELIKQGGVAASLTDTAFAAGYFDQSHFIHDFKAVTGLTPGGYLDYAQRRYG
ncbi:helix-turn-helix domain-containing protein [Billgrantia montanilacus]|uniref:AraC family transcriptional regulator n=1 Tax=Billgrantia montanilacus TaxID=2282305 RepID=A0A368TZH9_9GAMM|nr:helix-turn-helix domain-containing protein [Halomonas montanilacus]RCV90154.1 AraC family transcriptional regulator [Halomonas montanilacus]